MTNRARELEGILKDVDSGQLAQGHVAGSGTSTNVRNRLDLPHLAMLAASLLAQVTWTGETQWGAHCVQVQASS